MQSIVLKFNLASIIADLFKKDGLHFRIITTTRSTTSVTRRAIITTPTMIPPISPTLATDSLLGSGGLIGGPLVVCGPLGQSGDLRVSSMVLQVGSR